MSTETQIEVVMPQMGVSVSEGTITKWLKQPGDPIARDEPLLEISTDKVDTEVPSPGEGVLAEILVQEGETVEVGTVIARIGAAATPAPPTGPAAAPAPPLAPVAAPPEPPPGSVEPGPVVSERGPEAPADEWAATDNGKRFISPVVARIAAEHGVDLAVVPGTGTGGRVTKKDILAYIASRAPAPPEEPGLATEPAPAAVATPAPPPPAQPPPAPATSAPAAPPSPAPPAAPEPLQAAPGEALEPMSAMRRGIAEHMRRSLDTAAHVTSAIEVDMSRVVALRQKLKPQVERDHGVNLTYLAFIARAAVDTLADYPWINGEIRDDQIVTRSFVNLGIAVELAEGKGLIVPVLRNAETLNLLGIAKGIADLAQRARGKKLLPDEVQGGTFTITNPGSYGTFHGTPIINQPQTAILGTYAVVKRPWVVQDELGNDVIAIRPIMNLTLTYDHRLVDGALAGRFLRDLREKLEVWDEAAY
ncbi:MAG: 2-oxo acid dehydrogenase subunit E2 [Gaiellaceae bacterium]|nr:2-oxo acid dehydrogenase subunit E2 [Gaiellaceae bacterium]